MSTAPQTQAPITFDRFWKWLQEHPNCVVRAGGVDSVIFDNDNLHWEMFEDEEGTPICHLIFGKQLVAEIAIDRSQIVFVQSYPDPDEANRGFFMFELVGGSKEESLPIYHFVLTHGIDQQAGHNVLKH